MSGLRRTFFSLEGEATRREWWIVSLTVSVVFVGLLLVLMGAGPGYALMWTMADQPLVAGVVGAAMWLPSAPVTLRRLRARRLPIWWLAVAFGWTLLSSLMIRLADRSGAELLGNVLQLAGLALSIFLIVQLGFLPSKTAAQEPEAAA